MNSTPTAQPLVSKRIAVSVLIVMLGATALLSGKDSILNKIEWLTLAWPLLLIVVGSYCLRVFLAEHDDHHFDPEIKIEPWLSGSGLNLLPFLFTRS